MPLAVLLATKIDFGDATKLSKLWFGSYFTPRYRLNSLVSALQSIVLCFVYYVICGT